VADIEETARVVVGPDEPFGDWSRTDMEVLHREALVRTLREEGVVADVAKLRGMPHDVELSAQVVALSDAASAEERPERGA
jgi:acetyl esterase/lipase